MAALRRERVEELLGDGARVASIADLGSSHAWTLHRVSLDGGGELFVKAAPDQAGVFAAEAAGLRWLAAGGGAEPPVPEVVAADEHMLVLPWLPTAAPTARAAERFGRELAAMHAASPPAAYGASWEGFIADLPLDNTLVEGAWPGWYAERRLAPFLRRGASDLGPDGVRLVERVIEGIDALAGPPEPPARVHGDLWSGNVLWTDGRAMVIDPAAHGGHRETDLAMLALFGAPHLDRVVAAYDEAAALADGWRERVPLHQLHPLLVHVALFGAGYRSRTVEAARAALASAG
ncbi:fructosamine kinase family protein [Actinomadura viridis]|uniref:Fructosamine-3-kinase n=1 Tax=Actinomadura viridis TaxID=58110 RepID=A0A931DD10_9ACTN|nr:fructosamine kinase family protein [Actinomadura viridis]MBG6086157.1 fructosamine-3-kinase [Actinomadura viridis]